MSYVNNFSSGLGIHDHCDTGAMLYQLIYEATQVGAGQFVGLNEGLNSTNFLNVWEELASAGRAIRFTNPRVFHDMNKELFKVITSRFLTPLTLQNADTALRYCMSFIDTIMASPQYSINNTFCQENLTKDLTKEQLKAFLRQNNCTELTFEENDIFQFKGDASSEHQRHEQIQTYMEIVLLCISIAAIILALIVLVMLRLKNSEQLFIHKSFLFALGLGNLVFVLDKTSFDKRQELPALCSAVAVVQHYLHTAVFTWMLVEGINLYIKLVKVFSVKKQYAMYLVIGWGIPAVIVGLVAAIRPSIFDMGQSQTAEVTCGALNLTVYIQRTRCWMNGSLWIYKGPVLAILLVNFVLFAILLRVIFGKISTKYGNNRVIIAKKGLRSIIALLPLLGVTSLLGFLIKFHYALTYVYILLNSTQGVVFFIFHCVLDDQVQDALRKLRAKAGNKDDVKQMCETPASNPNNTPDLERNSRIGVLQHSDENVTNDGMTKSKTEESQLNETSI
ncbi:corticotropin-releasing factor receptor 1-like [Montipora foliosa]|uniref:corticotropin-releasing factor receptor 1-like n=1 Tax=Montipora foliosa TaxID=591990 RepID=UPI0035F191D4